MDAQIREMVHYGKTKVLTVMSKMVHRTYITWTKENQHSHGDENVSVLLIM